MAEIASDTYTASEARTKFSEIINKAIYKGPVVITRGEDAVAVVPIALLNILMELEVKSDTSEAKKALKEYREKGGISLEALKKELGID